MTLANTPPAAADLARLVTRVRTLERRLNAKGPRTVAGLDDVDADRPGANDLLTYDATLGKWINAPATPGPSTYPVGPLDDGTATYTITAAALVQKMSVTVNAGGENAYVGIAANGSVQQAAIAADDNAGHVAQVAAFVAGGVPFVALQAGLAISLFVRAGDPNGALSGNKGDVCFDTSTPTIWVNTTSSTVWVNP